MSMPCAMFARICLTSWCWPISWPKVWRSCAYLSEASRHAWASPTAPAATVNRPWSIALIAIEEALALFADPVVGRDTHLVEVDHPVLPARMPSFPWRVPVVRPGVPRSSRNAVTPLCRFARSTLAKTRKWSARSARLIHCFWPLSRYEHRRGARSWPGSRRPSRRPARSARRWPASRPSPAGPASADAAPRCPTGATPAS